MSSENRTDSRSGGVEVVADQGDDGSFEIRLERQPDLDADRNSSKKQRAATWHAEPTPERASSNRTKWMAGGVVIAALLLLTLLVLAQSTRPWGNTRPQTVEINDQPRFRGYVIAGEEPQRVRNVRLDNAANPAQNAPEQEDEPYNDAFEDDDDESGAENNDGPPRIELRSAASGSAQPPEGLSDAERRKFFKKQREERLEKEIREAAEAREQRRAAERSNEQDDDFDEYFDEDLEDDAYYDEYDEYDDDEEFDDEYDDYDPR